MPRLQARLLAVMAALTGGTVVLSALAVHFVAKSALRANLDESLIELARTELASATDMGFVHVHESGPRTLTIRGVPGYEKYVWIEDGARRVVARTTNLKDSTPIEGASRFEDEARSGKALFGDIKVGGQEVRAVFYPFEDANRRPLTGVVGVPTSVVSEVMASIGQVLVLVGFSCVALTFAIASVLAKSLSDPLKQVAAIAEKIDPSHPDTIASVEAPYEEVEGIASAINSLTARVSEMLDERNRTIEAQRQFVADASHELRTPVSNLQGTIEVALRRERLPDEYREALTTAFDESKRMGRLVEDLLALAKNDLGEFAIRAEPLDLGSLLREGVSVASEGRDGIEFAMSVRDDPQILGDRDRLRQAIDNLLRNALTHADTWIAVKLECVRGTARITIANDGAPLSEDSARRVFDRFVRLDTSRTRDTGGSGLGLAIVKAIVEGHRGSVRAVCDERSTSFVVDLPIEADLPTHRPLMRPPLV